MAKSNRLSAEHYVQPNAASSDEKRGYDRMSRKRAAIDWTEVNEKDISTLVRAACTSARALILGRTSDGGALSITVLDGAQRYREYCSSAEDFADYVDWFVHAFADD